MEPDLWTPLVESIRTGIRQGRYRKVVLARRAEAGLHGELDDASFISRLDSVHPETFRFEVRFDKAVFLGASPERLVGKEGLTFATDALAGSAPMPESRGEEDCGVSALGLIADPKERSEHAFVVDAMRRQLAPLCQEFHCPASPRVLRLRHVMHMHTPIRGLLQRRLHVLDLVKALHPTPAVGGVPTEAALQWIAENEPVSRGWYAGPVGWFDRRGDGEFAVALRCGVFRDGRAFLFAGAGIVEQSDPAAEYEETTVKQQALLSVFGDSM
jgi:menaquinone-specific isochorismate synthase